MLNIHEKLLALCGWIFEYVYEPVYKDDPRILYQKNLHRFVAMYSWLWFQKAGSEAEEAIRQFQAYMRSLDEAKAPLLFNRIQKPLSEYEREHPFEMVLRFAHGYRALIIADNAKIVDASSDRGRWVLDLSTSALWSHLNHWGKKKKPLKVHCDASKPLEDFHDKFKGDESDPGIMRARELYGPDSLGWKLVEPISFVDSRNFPAVQLADIVASAAVSFVAHGVPEDMQETASLIEQSFLRDSIFPDMGVVDLKNRSAAVNWLILYELAERAEQGADPYANLAEMYREAEISWARGDFQRLLDNQL